MPPRRGRARRLADDVWSLRLALAYPNVASVNAYLLRVEEGLVLVDCGTSLGDGWGALREALADAGARPEDVDVLLCTHAHADHYGLAADLLARTGCELRMATGPRLTTDVLREPTLPLAERLARQREAGVPDGDAPALADGLDSGDGHYERVEPRVLLAGGERLATASGDWQVLAAPGHCADQVMLWDARRAWLIGADLALAGVAPYVEYGTRPDPYADYLASLDRALGLAPRLLLPGHGRPTDDAVDVLTASHVALLEMPTAVLAGLRTGPRSTYELAMAGCGPDPGVGERQRALSGTLAVLEHLDGRGAVASTLDHRGVRRWVATGR